MTEEKKELKNIRLMATAASACTGFYVPSGDASVNEEPQPKDTVSEEGDKSGHVPPVYAKG